MADPCDHKRRVAAIGGGTGLPVVLRCLVESGCEATAIVTMADDGGSSGQLREQLGMLPPGDVRNCLVALADPGSLEARLFQYRFPHGEGLAGHALGNLVLAALADIAGGFPQAIEAAAGLLGSQGRVLPCTLADVHLRAVDATGEPVAGQALIANTQGPFVDIALDPPCPPANPAVLEAIASADAIVIGPGSLFTSILPNLLVDGVAEAVRGSSAKCVYVCNVANQRGETGGMDAHDHVRALHDHGLEGAIDVVLVHGGSDDGPWTGAAASDVCDDVAAVCEPVRADSPVRERIAAMGPQVRARDLVDRHNPLRHSAAALCIALREVIG